MPVYVYKCTKCDHQFERIVSVERRSKFQACPHCSYPSKFMPNQDFAFDMRPNKGKKLRRRLNAKQGRE